MTIVQWELQKRLQLVAWLKVTVLVFLPCPSNGMRVWSRPCCSSQETDELNFKALSLAQWVLATRAAGAESTVKIVLMFSTKTFQKVIELFGLKARRGVQEPVRPRVQSEH